MDIYGEDMPGLNLDNAAGLLADAKFTFPPQAAKLWKNDDGLPPPDAPQFEQSAARFIAEHPIPPPDGRSATWNLPQTASRQCKCLAYLADGKHEAKREVAKLCIAQAARLQWLLPIQVGSRPAPGQAFYAATGSLALTGGLLRRDTENGTLLYEVATQWLRTGMGQFATYGDKGKDKEHRAAAQALIDVVGVNAEALEIHGADDLFFSQLDLKRPDMQEVARHVADGDWEHAKRSYVDMLAERFSSKRNWPDIRWQRTVDIAEADDVCRNIFLLTAHMYRRCDFGESVDWTKIIDNDIESRVYMNSHDWLLTLLNAYQKTGDEKYVQHLCRLFNSWYENSPPTFKRSDAQWRTLEVGKRPSLRWGPVLFGISEHPRFKRECLLNMARSMLDHGKYLSMYSAGGGNWLQVECSGLACVALLFPEFKMSPMFYDVAMNRLVWVNVHAFLPDGFQSECSPGYHRFPVSTMGNALRFAKFLGVSAPAGLVAQYRTGLDVLQYIAYPDCTLPMLSDSGPRRHSIVEVIEGGAEVFERDDFRWFATEGKEGTPPARPSHDFTHAGYCVMRDKWGPDGQVLIFDAGYFGAGHQHEDKLNFVYYAGSRELIGDPGIYSYKRDEFEPYWRGTWSHNSIVINGLSQHRAIGPQEKIPDPDRRFLIGEGFDFAVGWYRHAYSPRNAGLWGGNIKSDSQAAIRDVQHQRCIFYIKGEYAIICDRVVGEGEHQIDVLFHPAPVLTGVGVQTEVRARAVSLEIRKDGAVVTREKEHANVAILPAQGGDLQVLDLIGQKDPVRGWYSLYGIQPSHDIVYRCRRSLPAHFETVIQPLPPGYATPLKVQPVQVECEGAMAAAALACGDDLFLLSYDGPAKMTCRNVIFEGTSLLLRYDARGVEAQAYVVDGRALSVGGKTLFSAEAPMAPRVVDLR
ncbi:MAG: alginate lyase family protein [Planctomycetota bacterium]